MATYGNMNAFSAINAGTSTATFTIRIYTFAAAEP
jgi:hypothetical protein